MDYKSIDFLIGKNLKRLRLKAGLTQEELADLLKISHGLIPKWESGKKGMGKKVIARLCNILKAQLHEFFIDKNTPLIKDELEQESIALFREAKDIDEDSARKILEYGKFIIKESKKTKKTTARKSKTI